MVKLLEFELKESNGNLKEIVYLLEDEEWGQYYRVVKLLRLLRTPRELSQIETLLAVSYTHLTLPTTERV